MHKPQTCDVKQSSGFQSLAPNASRLSKLVRGLRKLATVDPNFVRSRRFFRNKSSVINEQRRHINSGYFYIIHPLSKLHRFRQMWFVLIASFEIIAVPVRACFGLTYHEVYDKYNYQLFRRSIVEWIIITPFQIWFILASFCTGYVDPKSKKAILQPSKVVKKYLRTFYMWDLMSIIPVDSAVLNSKFIRFINVTGRLCRIQTILFCMKEFMLDYKVRGEIYPCFVLGYMSIYILNVFTCIFALLPGIVYHNLNETSQWPEDSWMVRAEINPPRDVPPMIAYSECFTCVICHFFGAGHGFYQIEDVAHENAILTLVMFAGRVWTLYLMAYLLRIFSVVTVSETKYEEYLLQLEVFIREKKLPKDLGVKLVEYYKYKYQNHFFNENAIFATLSTKLKEELVFFGARHLVHKTELFKCGEIIFVLIWGWKIFVTPVRACFGVTFYSVYMAKDYRTFDRSSIETYALLPFQLYIMFTYFVTGYIENGTREIVIDPVKIAKRYLKGFYIWDLMAILPVDSVMETARFTRFLNVIGRLVRIKTVLRNLKELLRDFQIKDVVYPCIVFTYITAYILNILTCIFVVLPGLIYYNAAEWPERSWMVIAHMNPPNDVTPMLAYSECLICILFHFLGAGHGFYELEDVPHENAILTVVMLIGRMWTLFMIAYLLKAFSVVTVAKTKYEEYLLQLEVYIREKKLPNDLRTKLMTYYKYKYQNHFFNEQAISSTLSPHLRQDVLLFGARHLINNVDIFKVFPKSVTAAIINSAKIEVYLPQDVIEKEGNNIDYVYFIASGTVAVMAGDLEIAHLEDGGDFGLAGVKQDYRKFKYTYITLETTEAYLVSIANMKTLINDKSDILQFFAEKVEERLEGYRQKLQHTRENNPYDILSDLSSGRILEHPRPRPTRYDKKT